MTKTPKAYRDDLSKDFSTKRKDANEKIKRIQDNPDFLESHKEEAIKTVKDNLYKELDDTRTTEEYQGAKNKKQALRGKKKDVKKQEEIVAEQKKLLGEKEDELNKMTEEYGEKTEKKESKEIVTKSLEFEKDTFKIDSKGWKEEKRNVYNKGEMKVKVNATGDVVEYLEGPAKGEQIFITYDGFIREVCKAKNCSKEEVEKKYLMTVDELKEKMKDKPSNSDEYKKFFNKEVKDHLAGYWGPNDETFSSIGERSDVWLAGGNNANFSQDKWHQNDHYRIYGFSGRLLKN